MRVVYSESLGTALGAHLIAGQSPAECPRGGNLRGVLEYIEEHLASDLSLFEIASVAGLSVSHAKSIFRGATGLPIHQYVIRRRVQRAVHLLAASAMPISQIALECGFAHQSPLARHMRRLVGVSPAEYALRSPIRRDKRSRGAAS